MSEKTQKSSKVVKMIFVASVLIGIAVLVVISSSVATWVQCSTSNTEQCYERAECVPFGTIRSNTQEPRGAYYSRYGCMVRHEEFSECGTIVRVEDEPGYSNKNSECLCCDKDGFSCRDNVFECPEY